MNIFVLHENPTIAAQYHCDRHVVKMVLETAQLLSTTHHILSSPLASRVYQPTHKKSPVKRFGFANRSKIICGRFNFSAH